MIQILGCLSKIKLTNREISSVVDPDSDPHGSAFIGLSWIRIWIRIGNADPDPDTHYVTLQSDQYPAPGFGSGSALR